MDGDVRPGEREGATRAQVQVGRALRQTVDETVDVFPAKEPGAALLVTFGGEESKEFHRQSTEYLEAWRANGLRGELLIQEAKHHYSAIEGLTNANSPLCKALIDFMTRCEIG